MPHPFLSVSPSSPYVRKQKKVAKQLLPHTGASSKRLSNILEFQQEPFYSSRLFVPSVLLQLVFGSSCANTLRMK